MSHAGMTCKQLVELTTEYFEGTLFPPDRVRFQAHLKTCAHCASYVEQMCQTIKALGRLPGGTVAGHVMEALLRTFRRWQQDPRTVDFFQLGTSSDEVPPGSHMVHCYATDQQRDDFARRYMDAGLRAGESCVILGDPAFVDYTAQLLRAAEPADGWSGRLFVAPWDREPSLDAVQQFVELHRRINEHGPSGLLPEAPLRGKGRATTTCVRALGNFRHWSRTERGSRCTLQICASVEETYQGGTGIVVCQWETSHRSAAFRWGALAVHTHMVNGTCIAQPSEVLERYVQDGVAGIEELLATLQTNLTRHEDADVTRAAREAELSLAGVRHFLASLDARQAPNTSGRR